jgi:hypothetical protein
MWRIKMNLHELAPELFTDGDTPDFELEKVYKQRSGASHLDALETIFEMGFEFAIEKTGQKSELEEQSLVYDALRYQYNELLQKHEALKRQVATYPPDAITEGGQQERIRDQAMGMGLVFKT